MVARFNIQVMVLGGLIVVARASWPNPSKSAAVTENGAPARTGVTGAEAARRAGGVPARSPWLRAGTT